MGEKNWFVFIIENELVAEDVEMNGKSWCDDDGFHRQVDHKGQYTI